MTDTTPTNDIGVRYARGRQQITDLVRALDSNELATQVAACPGWTVADVVGHLTGLVEDALSGRITGPPDDAQTTVEVERHRRRPIADVLADWASGAPSFESVITDLEIWPALIDVTTHEHDIRAALGRPDNREDPTVALLAGRLMAALDLLGVGVVTVTFPDGTSVSSAASKGTAYGLRATAFDVLRFRLGRRTRREMLALAWDRDPSAIVDRLCFFGPTMISLGE